MWWIWMTVNSDISGNWRIALFLNLKLIFNKTKPDNQANGAIQRLGRNIDLIFCLNGVAHIIPLLFLNVPSQVTLCFDRGSSLALLELWGSLGHEWDLGSFSLRLSWSACWSWESNLRMKSLFCGSCTPAQTNTDSLLAEPAGAVQIPSLAGEGMGPSPSNCFLQAALSQSVLLFPFVHLIAERRDQMLCDKS